MNPHLAQLHPYPFEKLAQLKQGITPPADKAHIALSIGEPKHATPELISNALLHNIEALGKYPTTKGLPELRVAMSEWVERRFQLSIDPESQVLPVNGTREALFAFAQKLFAQENITVLPGSFLSREVNGVNPGKNHVRMALVAPVSECIEAAHRIKNFINSL